MTAVNVSLRPLSGGIVVLDLRGFVDKSTIRAIDESIGRLLEQGKNKLVVNCRELSYIASDGMAVFLSHLIKIRKSGGDIKFAAMSREVRTVFTVIGLGKLLEVHDTEDAAVKEFERREREKSARLQKADEPTLAVEQVPHGTDIAVLRFRGFIDRHTIDILEGAIHKAMDDGRPKLAVNCAGLKYINSSGIGVFLAQLAKVRARGGDFRFCHMGEIARTWISMFGLQHLFKVFETEAEAVASYRS